ncbi:MAG: hypothetical protein Kow0063_39570 [Anaerolineae bacterium]
MNRKASVFIVGWLVLASLLAVFMLDAFESAPVVKAEIVEEGDYGMALNQRFHQLHTVVAEMNCTRCHVEEAPLEVAQPPSEAPGPVDRRVCLGCHLTGPAPKFYEPKE